MPFARVLFGYETTWKPRGAGATATTRDRPVEGGRFDYGRGPSARMLTQFGHPLEGCRPSPRPHGLEGEAGLGVAAEVDGAAAGEAAPPLAARRLGVGLRD